MLDMKNILKELCETSAPSGFEQPVADKAAELLSPFVDRVKTDRLGNVLGMLSCGEKDAKTVMLDAHLDEIGLMVTGQENGFLRFRTLGGVDPRMLPAREVILMTEPPVRGYIACLPPHVMSAEDMNKAPEESDLYIDVGEAEVPAGTVGTFFAPLIELGQKKIAAKSMDDRACFAVILRALEIIPALELLSDKHRRVNIVVCGSTQEEMGGRGAVTAAFGVNPDYAAVLDVTFGRTPDSLKSKTFVLGGGPCIGVGPECDRTQTQRLKDIAREQKIPYQIEVLPGRSGTNATGVQTVREGVATCVLSVPLRYMHSPVETLDLDDIENTARLLAQWVVEL